MQRAEPLASSLCAVGGGRLYAGVLRHHREKGVKITVDSLDPSERGFDDLNGGQITGGNQTRKLSGGPPRVVVRSSDIGSLHRRSLHSLLWNAATTILSN